MKLSRAAKRREATRECARKRRERFERLGACLNCGGTRVPGKKKCEKCLASERAAGRRYQARKRAAFKAIGICMDCRENEAMPGRKRCGYCQEREQERKVERRKLRLERAAQAAFRGYTREQMEKKQYGKSGKTYAQILDEHEAHDARIDAAIAWVKVCPA